MMIEFPTTEEELMIPGAVGQLQILASTPKQLPVDTIALICHPHPQQHGTMSNKVVTTIHKACELLGMRTVRFNFRGVDKSEGEFDNGIGETLDALAVLDWIKSLFPTAKILLSGFSFGTYVAYRAAIENSYQQDIVQLLSIAPAYYPAMQGLPAVNIPWMLVQAGADEIVDNQQILNWIKGLNIKPTVLTMENASHFFHKRLVDLRKLLVEVLS